MSEFRKKYTELLKQEREMELQKHSETIELFKNYVRSKGIELDKENFTFSPGIGVIASAPNLLSYLRPDLKIDKEGLVDFQFLKDNFERKVFASGLLYSENFVLMAHNYFRRGYGQHTLYAPNFIQLFWKLNENKVKQYISLDFDRVRIDVNSQETMELDTWFGVKFNKDINLLSDDITQLKPPIGLDDIYLDSLFADSIALDISWETQESKRVFKAEEFKIEKVIITIDNVKYFPVRYVHAEFDPILKCFVHFDGAIHLYTQDEYDMRIKSDANYNSKNPVQIKARAHKLFKFDGEISIETWMEFVSNFFSQNNLIVEYFEGEYPDWVQEWLNIASKQNLNHQG